MATSLHLRKACYRAWRAPVYTTCTTCNGGWRAHLHTAAPCIPVIPVRRGHALLTNSITGRFAAGCFGSELKMLSWRRCLCSRSLNDPQKPKPDEAESSDRTKKETGLKKFPWFRGWADQGNKSDTSQKKRWLDDHEARSIALAFGVNAGNFVLKIIFWYCTGSHSMFAEAVHSFLDMCNQGFLLYGYRLSLKEPDDEHPYGYRKIRTVVALVGGCMLFSLGAFMCASHVAVGLLYGGGFHSENAMYAVIALLGSLISESASFGYTFSGTWKASAEEGVSVWSFIRSGQQPLAGIVIYEDITAVMGVIVAAVCMMLSETYNTVYFDMAGEAIVGLMLTGVAWRVYKTYGEQLNYKSIPARKRRAMQAVIRNDPVVRAVHDCKTTDLGMGCYRLKAEVDFNGREITRRVLQNRGVDTDEKVHSMTEKELHDYLLNFGEDITKATAKEIDRMEKTLKERFPGLIHIDLEPH